jgi:Zn-finger nucleic acid-binding protein
MKLMPGPDYFFCEYCGAYAFPSPSSDGVVALGEDGDVACPVCSTRLVTASVGEVRVLHCPKCRGVLAGQETFSTIVELLRARASGEPEPVRPMNREELQREIVCPYCGRLMNTHPFYGPGNIVVDNCPYCSVIWLDYGELASIRDAPGRDRGRAELEEYSLIDVLLAE